MRVDLLLLLLQFRGCLVSWGCGARVWGGGTCESVVCRASGLTFAGVCVAPRPQPSAGSGKKRKSGALERSVEAEDEEAERGGEHAEAADAAPVEQEPEIPPEEEAPLPEVEEAGEAPVMPSSGVVEGVFSDYVQDEVDELLEEVRRSGARGAPVESTGWEVDVHGGGIDVVPRTGAGGCLGFVGWERQDKEIPEQQERTKKVILMLQKSFKHKEKSAPLHFQQMIHPAEVAAPPTKHTVSTECMVLVVCETSKCLDEVR